MSTKVSLISCEVRKVRIHLYGDYGDNYYHIEMTENRQGIRKVLINTVLPKKAAVAFFEVLKPYDDDASEEIDWMPTARN